MTSSLTSRLKMHKADPGSGEPVDVAKLNQSLDKMDAAVGPANVTSGTRPATPYANQLIRESDTRRMLVWNATQSSWDAIPVAGGTFPSQLDSERTTSGSLAYTVKVTGDAQQRFAINATGMHDWGDGVSARDVNLYRSAANVLKTDDAFQAGGAMTAQGRPVVTSVVGTAGRLAWWTGTVTTNASGVATITHGAGFTPDAVLVCQNGNSTAGATFISSINGSHTSTTTQVLVRNLAGALYVGSVGITVGLFA